MFGFGECSPSLIITSLTVLDGTDEAQDAHQQVYGGEQHEAKFSHELLAGGAAFEGMKLFEDHQRKEGKFLSLCMMLLVTIDRPR